MKRKGIGKILIGLVCIALFAGVFAEKSSAWWRRERKEEPKVLRMGLVPAEDMKAMIALFKPTVEYLERELGMKIETFKATDYTAVIEAMRAKKIDVAYFGPFSYILAAERANAQAIVAGAEKRGVLGVYHSIMIAHRDTGLRNMDDVKKRAGELTLSFVDPASTSGYLVPKGFMKSIGINPKEDFREVIFAGGHDASILAVGGNRVDLGATWEGPFKRAVDKGLIKPEDVIVVWTSEGIPNSPIAVRGDMDLSLARKIQQAFLDMPYKAPEAMEKLRTRWRDKKYYVAVDDRTYDFMRVLARGLGKID